MTISTPTAAGGTAGAPAKPGPKAGEATNAQNPARPFPEQAQGEGGGEESFATSLSKIARLAEEAEAETLLPTPVDPALPTEQAVIGPVQPVAVQKSEPVAKVPTPVAKTEAPPLPQSAVPTARDATAIPVEADLPEPKVTSQIPQNVRDASREAIAPVVTPPVQAKAAPKLVSKSTEATVPTASTTDADPPLPVQIEVKPTSSPTPIAPPQPGVAAPKTTLFEDGFRQNLSAEVKALPFGEAAPSAVGENTARGREVAVLEVTSQRQERVLSQSIANQISQVVRSADGGRFEIALDPPELGRVTVTLVTTGDTVTAQIASDRPEIGDMLRRHNDMLHREFTNAGFRNVTLDFGFQQQGRDAQGTAQTAGQQSEPLEIDDLTTNGRRAPTLAASGLDLRV